jgi:H+/Cl- antiporter ClcA
MPAFWTFRRAMALGAGAELAALLVWPFFRLYREALEWPFAVLAALAGLCGVSILLMTAADLVQHRRGRRIKPLRGFDFSLGGLLVGLSLLQIQDVRAGWLP